MGFTEINGEKCTVNHSISTKTFDNVCRNTAASHSYRMRWPRSLYILEYPDPLFCNPNLNRTILVTIVKYCTFSSWQRIIILLLTYLPSSINKGEGAVAILTTNDSSISFAENKNTQLIH